ncbi:MAG: glycosyltransferase [Gaiellaceae bacterium]
MLQAIQVGRKALADYASIIERGLADEIRELAEPLAGARVLHLSSTAFGGGVAEIMYALIPLMRDVGLDVEWRVMHGEPEFFDVTKAIHNGLQGAQKSLSEADKATFERYNVLNAERLEGNYDFVVIHDPQPAAIARLAPEAGRHWIWRCHIDISTPNPDVLGFLLPNLSDYAAAVFHRRAYVPHSDRLPEVVIWPPAIDPLAPKNMALSREDAAYILDGFGIDTSRPLMTQISRFDPWKDPVGVIDAFRLTRDEVPGLQLALVGSMAHDDPEGWDFYNATVEYAGEDADIHILSNLNNVGAVEVNAFQVASEVVVQKSIREGFGLTVTEALWKGRPTVAGRVGGIVDQVTHAETGYLVESPEECAAACIEVFRDPEAARDMALRGKEHVRRRFLMPRLLRDWISLFARLEQQQPSGARGTGGATET